MSNTTTKLPTCPKCGAPIPLAAPQGLCPKCVLLGAATATEQGVPATATSEIPSIERIAVAFPQLQILELVGRGGMGFVFKARQPHLDRFVALKLLPDKLAKDAQFAERFNREGRVLAKLNHPNIVSIFDFGQTGGFYYLLMEYVDGVNLRQAMRAGRFSPGEALSIVPKICEALQYAHEQGILHRDIKPENILLDAKGRVKIADFGIAKLVGEDQPSVTLTNTGAALGTLHYMAPEQLEKPSTVDHRADIYSLGVVFYEMLTGELPIGRFAPPSSKTPVGASVDEVVFRTLEKDRERRFQSAGEMRTQVEHLGDGGAGAPDAMPPGLAGEGAVIPRWSPKAVWGAVLTGLSLPLSLLSAILIYLRAGGVSGWPILLAAGAIGLPGLAGTILGWMALSDIRTHQGRLRGLPLAVFAALVWPLLVLLGVTLVFPWVSLSSGANHGTAMPIAGMLMLLVPLGTITFAIWAVYAAVHWAGNQPPTHRRDVLKWVFICLLVFGFGIVLLTARHREAQRALVDAERAAALEKTAAATAPKIQFTFTTVELREEEGARWLAMDFVEQIRGDCQRTFRYSASVPGFTMQTRTTSVMTDPKAGFAPVLHQRIMWKLPDSLSQPEAQALRDLVGKERIGKPIVLEPGEEYPLFKTVVASGGSLVAAVGVKLTSEAASSKPQKTAAPSSGNTASAELWAPKLAPGEKPNPSEILQEAKSLAQEGRYEEALQRQIWYHNHALEIDSAQTGVRLSFALSSWTELARRYPKAKEALVEIRDRGTRAFAEGEGYFGLFMDVSAINEQFGQKDATLALFKSIQSRDPKLARQCYWSAEDLLVETGDYALCASFISDFQRRFESIRAARERVLELVDRNGAMNQTSLRRHAERTFLKDVRKLVEILVGVGRKAEAEQIRDQAVAVLNVPELQSAVADAEKNVERAATTK
jgi:tRNA A-37 threonylcarbamoyl transferase component Bud32